MQTIAIAAQRILAGEGEVYVAGGVESISCVQNEMNTHMLIERWLKQNKPEIYWPMLQTAETVAKRYNIARERQDEYGVRSQQRAASAAAAGKFTDEIVPMTTTMATADKDGRMFTKEVTIGADEGIRADTTYEGVSMIRSAVPGGVISAGNAPVFRRRLGVRRDELAARRKEGPGACPWRIAILPESDAEMQSCNRYSGW